LDSDRLYLKEKGTIDQLIAQELHGDIMITEGQLIKRDLQ